MEKVPNWECRFVHRKQGLFLSENVDDIKIAGKKQNIAAMWKNLMKEADLFEPALFLDRVYYGFTQRDCKPNDDITQQYNEMSESHISAGATEKLPGWDKLHAKTMACPTTLKDMLKKCVERYCELAKK